MKLFGIKIVLMIVIIIVTTIIIAFILCFANQNVSNDISDWAALGNYFGGMITPIITVLNLYLFYILTKATTKFTEENTKKQLCYGTCHDYQKKINELVFNCINNIELYNQKCSQTPNDIEIYKQQAKSSLIKLTYFVESFYNEVQPYLKKDIIQKQKDELNDAIKILSKTDFKDITACNQFITKKSDFIKTIFENII